VQATLESISEEVIGNRLILKQRLFLLRMHEGTHIKSHIAEFIYIINELDKKEFKIEDGDQVLLLLCSFSSSYKSFRDAIIYRGKSTIKVNEVKEHILNKNKRQAVDGSLITMTPGKFFLTKEKSNNRNSMGNPKHKNLVYI